MLITNNLPMKPITAQILKDICLYGNIATFQKYVDALNRYMAVYGINTELRVRHFIAQVAHESGCFRYVLEGASGSSYDTGRLAERLGNTPEADGDGQKYKGRGLIQVTGRANYEKCSIALFGDKRLLATPELLEQAENAVRSACWFWSANNLNALADNDDIRAVTKRINGGYNGLEHRAQLYERAKLYIK